MNNTIDEVPLSYALGISPLITENYLKDPSFKEIKFSEKTNKMMICIEIILAFESK